jgi:hypothetical protein
VDFTTEVTEDTEPFDRLRTGGAEKIGKAEH